MNAPTATLEQDKQLEHKLVRELTLRYVIALALVATLSTAAWFSLRLVIAEQSSTAAVVNISGRQRMLCQRTALMSNLLVNAPIKQRPEIRNRLNEAINLMESSHHALLNGSKTMNIPARLSETVRSMYFDGPDALDHQLGIYLQTVKQLMNAPDDKLNAHHPELQYISTVAAGNLVESLNRMVNQYQLEGEQSIRRLSQAETSVWLLTILLLILEILLIFRPMISHTTQAINRLQQVIATQRLQEEILEDMVKQRTQELEQQAHIDYLTQVNNRRHFMTLAEAELERAIRYETPLSLFMIDIDWFKSVNDLHGHKAGDLVLKKMTEICRQTLRNVDIIGRIGGEEFAVILPETDLADAVDVAERLRTAVAETLIPLESQQQINITISIGVAQLKSPENKVDMLLNRADKALYRAKENGRNLVVAAGN